MRERERKRERKREKERKRVRERLTLKQAFRPMLCPIEACMYYLARVRVSAAVIK